MNGKFYGLASEKQSRILNGAIKQFAIMGYRKASMQDIASECGISKALLFHYFGSKICLFSFVYNHSYGLFVKSLKAFQYREGEDIFEMIRRSNIIKLDLFNQYPYLYKFLYKSYLEKDAEVQIVVKEKNLPQINDAMPDVSKYMDKSKLRDGILPEKALQLILWVSEGFLQNKLDANYNDPDTLFHDYNEWMDTLKLCLYKS